MKRSNIIWQSLKLSLFLVAILPVLVPIIILCTWEPKIRKEERKIVAQRVEAIGGWDVLRKECETIAAQYSQCRWSLTDADIVTYDSKGNARGTNWSLPINLSMLSPERVEIEKVATTSGPKLVTNTSVVHLRFFYGYCTGAGLTPYYGIDVICGQEMKNYKPKSKRFWSLLPDSIASRHLADRVYEVYEQNDVGLAKEIYPWLPRQMVTQPTLKQVP